jgi:DTW domain-containing protein YfiP
MSSIAPRPLGAPRAICARCRRPERVCYCAALPELPTRTRVVILQHPRERDMPIGTARMAALSLPGAELYVGVRWSEHPALAAALADPARPPILLYPGPGARDVLADPPPAPVTLVVVDGTWSQAKVVVRDNPVLRALPRYAFAAPEPSEYRIRREPRAEYCSTIEALMHVLGALEGEPARFRAMLGPLRAMVDAQLAAQASAPRRGPRAPRRRPPRRWALPAPLDAGYGGLVLAVGEANAWPYAAAGAPGGRRDELVQWAAVRPATGEVLSCVAAPAGPLAPSTTFHTELSEADLRAGAPAHEVVAAVAQFVRPSDTVATWGTYGLGLLAAAGWTPAAALDLRAVAQRREHRRIGALEGYADALVGASGAPAGPAGAAALGVPGRAGRRLALLTAVVAAWRAAASAE